MKKGEAPQKTSPPRNKSRLYLRRGMAATALAFSILALGLALGHKYLEIDTRFRFNALVYTELTKSGIDIKVGESDKLLDVALIFLGALAGLILAKPNEAKVTLRDRPEMLMFLSSVILLSSSVLCHDGYLSAVADVCFQAKVDRANTYLSSESQPTRDWKVETTVSQSPPLQPYAIESQLTMEDVRDPAVEYLLQGQTWFLAFGAIISCMVLVSANLLKESQK
jgi:hypothetical protein